MSKKRAKKTTPRVKKIVSKAAFVRSFPVVMPAKEVVAQARSQGILLTDAYVYNVRATWKAGAKAGKIVQAKSPKRRRPNLKVRGRGGEDLLRALASELGLARAISVLQAEQDRVHSLPPAYRGAAD